MLCFYDWVKPIQGKQSEKKHTPSLKKSPGKTGKADSSGKGRNASFRQSAFSRKWRNAIYLFKKA